MMRPGQRRPEPRVRQVLSPDCRLGRADVKGGFSVCALPESADIAGVGIPGQDSDSGAGGGGGLRGSYRAWSQPEFR